MDAPDASSIIARLKPSSRLPLDPNLTAALIQEKQFCLLETLMNNPQLSPPGEIDGNKQADAVAMVPVKLSTPPSKSSPGEKGLTGILKNIESDVFSTPIVESRTRKGINVE
jgi:hypothetical protein